ncbi:galectin-9-like [Octodon degus]|uniref:Galectin n=1 Tax=Octodon degus TaxID=10160 RepID=A0A6P6ETL2_OCTDE|nr:galectin-9-like [Octodon degus]
MELYSVALQVPHHISIHGGLHPSRVITVSGTVPENAQRFHINLCTERDIAFHFNPRFDQNSVVCNTQIQGIWGTEERKLPVNMPFRRGQSFTVAITCEADHYSVSVDDQHLLDYTHRLPELQTIVHLEMGGDFELSKVSV